MVNKKTWLIIAILALLELLLCSCTTISTTPSFYSNNSKYDFVILGEVTCKNSTGFGFQEFLKVARSKYPTCDYVIDVMVDSETETTKFFVLSSSSTTYTMRGTAIRYIRNNMVTFPSNFLGTWKRDNFDNTLTFTKDGIYYSSQANPNLPIKLIDVSLDLYTLEIINNERTFTISINFVNNNIEISGGTGSGQGNWNGIWKKQ